MNIGQESPGSMQELKQERWDEAELLRDSRILEHTHSFIVEYNFKTKQCYIDPAQKRHVYGDWAGWAKDKRRDYSRIALKEDIPKLARYADKEANPLYPVPVLMDAGELEQFYYAVSEQ